MKSKQVRQVVGKPLHRLDAIEKVTGSAKYVADLTVEGTVDGKVLRSPYPHGIIRSIDTRDAERSDGVLGIVTSSDFKNDDPYLGSTYKDQPVIAIDRVRYIGEPVCAVAAEDEAAADAALELINVDYEVLPAVSNLDEAMSESAPLLHEKIQKEGEFPNFCYREDLKKGDVGEGFRLADEIFEDTFDFPMIYHYAMEPHSAIARVESNGMTVWSAAQDPFALRKDLAAIFRMPLSNIRVVVPYIGGGYGSKTGVAVEPLALALARKIGWPVRIVQSIPDSMVTSRRHAVRCWVKTGVKRSGEITAREAKVYLDTGAYTETGPNTTSRATVRVLGPYRYPHFNVSACCVFTNTVPASSFRAVGGAQTVWASESQMDIIASSLKMDPHEFRKKNMLSRGESLYPGIRAMDANLRQGLRKVIKAVGMKKTRGERKEAVGIAVGVTNSGGSGASTALVRLHQDASVTVLAGTTEIGQGSRTVLCQIAAEEMGVPLSSVSLIPPDTAFTSFDASTHSSRSTTVMG
ncbi:MAG: xanthine dehydrogenase family protein, partial [Candidatus Binatia bacterium]|nr:xanthine dehydrogenase family protein [Candidatus Binatia bacterium]